MDNFNLNLLLMILPLIVIQFGLAIFCIVKIFREGVANLNKWIWFIIVLFGQMLGPIAFLMIGRRRDNFD